MDKALVGDTSIYVYGSAKDPEYWNSSYSKIDESKEIVAAEHPKYVRRPAKRVHGSFAVREQIGTSNAFVSSGPTSWIDAHPSRKKILAWTLAATALAAATAALAAWALLLRGRTKISS